MLEEQREAFYKRKYGDGYKEALDKAGPVIDRIALHQEMVDWALKFRYAQLKMEQAGWKVQDEFVRGERKEVRKELKLLEKVYKKDHLQGATD